MSVGVKGMDMPTGCGSCPFARYLSDKAPYCARLMQVIKFASSRLPECPLFDLPYEEVRHEPPES